MKRYAYDDLLKWKNSSRRKPLILYGARQTGKTWLLNEFGKAEYKSVFYMNFDTNREFHQYFGDNIAPQNIVKSLENHFKQKILPADSLLIFDEIQECQRAKDSLKYFNENAPQYNIAAAGSFLGIAGGKFPVGQVDEITLYPLSFYEFLEATGHDKLAETLSKPERGAFDTAFIRNMHGFLTDRLKEYYYVGGMPEAVNTFMDTDDLNGVRVTQEAILNNYKGDFSRHIKGVDIPKVRMLWDSIPFHLSREKKKFIYKDVKTGGRASEFENAMDWLVNTGLVYRVAKTTESKIPLSGYMDRNAFKLYMLDVGLLSAKAALNISAFYQSNTDVFKEFKGAITEQYVLQELKTLGRLPVFYWGSATGKAEVDFVVQYGNDIVPIEVKSDLNKKSYSLSVYMEAYNPMKAVRTSLNKFGIHENLYSIPLYMIGSLLLVCS